jgi:thiol-disulfide isomerase/thioredoxin
MTGSNQGAKHPGADPYSKLSKAQERRRNTGPLIVGATALIVVIIALVVFLATRGGDDSTASSGSSATQVTTAPNLPTGASAAKHATQETASVTVQGQPLPDYPSDATGPFTTAADDPAVGKLAPTLVGQTFDGSKLTIDPADGAPKLILFVAHWCPHCQREVPEVQQWLADGNLPKGVEIYTVSTAYNREPAAKSPSEWLSSVGWQPPVLLDDKSMSAASAYGLPGFPYFVLTDGKGQVVARGSGEIAIDDVGDALEDLARTGATGSATSTTPATGATPTAATPTTAAG